MDPSSLRQLCAAGVLAGLLAHPEPGAAISGIEGTFEYSFDAPWRLEPSLAPDGSLEYGQIPIQLTIHDAMHSALDTCGQGTCRGTNGPETLRAPAMLGNVCKISVYETLPTGHQQATHFSFDDLAEVEASWGAWAPPRAASALRPVHRVCRRWRGESCTNLQDVSQTSEWHGLLWYRPRSPMSPGQWIRLAIQMQLGRDAGDSCSPMRAADRITLENAVRVYLGDAPLPRFGPGWLNGDLHYHAQGSDNEGESAYSYRGVVRALGAIGLDFVFATDHASEQRADHRQRSAVCRGWRLS
jgi:hypothetical protein